MPPADGELSWFLPGGHGGRAAKGKPGSNWGLREYRLTDQDLPDFGAGTAGSESAREVTFGGFVAP